MEEEKPEDEELTVGLILTSSDSEEDKSLAALFEEAAEDSGFALSVYTPDVTEQEAAEASGLSFGTFDSCDVNPIEYQMFGVNEMVASGVDAIVIRPNHAEALDGVLSAARAVGIRVCVLETETSEGTYDFYAENAEEALEWVKEGCLGL